MEKQKYKLTDEDKKYLVDCGHSKEDFAQIERAMAKTTYEKDGNRITYKQANELLGRELFLSGISRSAFHWSATSITDNGIIVEFDSSKFFRET
jgi:hypothetical protein